VLAQYDGEVSYVDAQLARLLAAVDTTNTLVAVIADHGESLGEHDVWFNHEDVYETSLHVPFALRWPGRVPVTRVESPVEGTDLAPTVLDLLGIPVPAGMTGKSAVPAMAGEGGRATAHAMCFDRAANVAARKAGKIDAPKYRTASVRGANSRYVATEVGGKSSYFELSTDPLGVDNVEPEAHATPEGFELMTLLKASTTALFAGDATTRSAIEVSDEEREKLKALGYMDDE
jgi:hypothetical protein